MQALKAHSFRYHSPAVARIQPSRQWYAGGYHEYFHNGYYGGWGGRGWGWGGWGWGWGLGSWWPWWGGWNWGWRSPYAYSLYGYYPSYTYSHPPSDGYYSDVNRYTDQLRALEKAADQDSKSAADRFLLGYHYLMTGARDAAQTQLAEALQLTPKDKLADYYLGELKSRAALTPPTPQQLGMQSPPSAAQQTGGQPQPAAPQSTQAMPQPQVQPR